jgi:hypothetical protein
VFKYYLAYNGKLINFQLTEEEAVKMIFELRGSIKGLSIMVYDENDKFIRQILKPKRS